MANLSKPLAAAAKLFEDAVTACGYIRNKDGLAFISAEKWSDYTQEYGEYSTDTARRSALSRAKKQLIENGIIKEVKGGFQATEAAMSGVFAGCFMGLETFG